MEKTIMQKAKVCSGGRTFSCDVVIVTRDGAVLKPLKGAGFQQFFVMELNDGRSFDCEVMDWMGDLLALKFAKECPLIANRV